MSNKGKSNKDSAMAAYMKLKGIKRTTGACPMCHSSVNLDKMQVHIMTCRG